MRIAPLVLTTLFALAIVPTRAARAEEITVSAAISLKDAMAEVARQYQAETKQRVRFNFGGSGQLMAQIREGAPVDLFISAADRQVDALAEARLVDASSRQVVAGNTLVLVVPAGAGDGAPASFRDLASDRVKRIAVGQPRTVPAGQYATEVLKALKIDGAVADRLVYGSNVRQVLDYVERGEVDVGVVYRTDALIAGEKVKVVATAEPAWHAPIRYPAALVSASRNREAAGRFLTYLRTPAAQAVFAKHGFEPAEEQQTATTRRHSRGRTVRGLGRTPEPRFRTRVVRGR